MANGFGYLDSEAPPNYVLQHECLIAYMSSSDLPMPRMPAGVTSTVPCKQTLANLSPTMRR